MGFFSNLFGGGPQATTTSTSSPWKNSQPYLNKTMGLADNWLDKPGTNQIFGGSVIPNFSSQSLWGMGNQQNFAQGPGQRMQWGLSNIISNGGFNPYQVNALSGLGTMANDPMMAQMASGQMLGKGNPFMRDALNIANENAMTSVGDSMSAAGRYGSGTMQGTLAKTINDSNTQALANQYNQDVANMFGASGQRMNSLGALFNAGQQGIGNMSSAYQTGMMPGTTMGQIGSAYEALQGNKLQEQKDQFTERRDLPLDQILRANSVFTGAGQLGSSTTQKQYQPTNWTQIFAGGASNALSRLFGF